MPADDDRLNLDFNTLRTLRHVFRLGSFSAAAATIGVKQSTVSYTIDRLRKALDDPLFVRQGGKNVPTDRCRALIPMIDRIVAEAENIEYQGIFDPARVKARFSIICSAFGERVLLPKVLRRVRQEAPGLRLDLEQRHHGTAEHLLEGRADLALVFSEINENGIYGHPRLYVDHPVCVMAPDNPLVGKTLSPEDISSGRHVTGRLWANWKQPYIAAAEKMGATIYEAQA